jgi:7,8-dihydropterin-6-yl-methyl-4-(beta-D-ribofuranosyl)aminobenzene 5'-phosphate synthase
MRRTIATLLAAAGLALGSVQLLAAPPPCTEEELLATSALAIDGYVLGVTCGDPYDSGDCVDDPEGLDAGRGGFEPEMVADCTAVVEVVRALAGEAATGDHVDVPFLALVAPCEGGIPLVPGRPRSEIRESSRIRWYDSPSCAWSNLFEDEPPFIRGDATEDGQVDISDAIGILQTLFTGGAWPAVRPAADANRDGQADIADPIYLLQYLFAGGPQPPAPFPLRSEVSLTVAFDNYPFTEGLDTAWGFSCLIETPEEKVMVDAGPDGTGLLANLAALGIDPAGIDRVVFTHNHPDHTTGAVPLLKKTGPIPVYIPASFPASFRDQVAALVTGLIDVSGPLEIAPGILSTGELAGSPREQVLIIPISEGAVVVTACAHPGIAALAREAKRQSGKEIALLLGGFHLFQDGDAEVRATIGELKALGVRKVAPCHCTGDRAIELLQEEYGDGCISIGAGARLSFGR